MKTLAAGAAALGITLSEHQLAQLETYYQTLVERNREFNLTRITDYEEVQVRHFLDSLTALAVMGEPASLAGKRVIDVGTGAGMPGLPVKIAAPELRLTLLEATGKKTAFLRDTVTLLGLEDVGVVTGRAEEIARRPGHREGYDFVLARAVAALPVLAELMLPLCAVGGLCISHKKGDVAGEVKEAEKAVRLMGGQVREIRPVNIIPGETDRCLVVLEKTGTTPESYPRRPGMPAKRPLL